MKKKKYKRLNKYDRVLFQLQIIRGDLVETICQIDKSLDYLERAKNGR